MNKFKFFVVVSILLIGVLYYRMSLGSSYAYEEETVFTDLEEASEPEIKFDPPQIFAEPYDKKDNLKDKLLKKCNISSLKKKLRKSCDYNETRNLAAIIASKSEGEFNIGQVCDIWDYCKEKWAYVDDPATSFISSASNTIRIGFKGDCDDFAVVNSALILGIGGRVRINVAYNDDGGHAFTEVNVGDSNIDAIQAYINYRYKKRLKQKVKINYRVSSDGNKWLNLDWFSEYPGGKYFNFNHGTSYYILQDFCESF